MILVLKEMNGGAKGGFDMNIGPAWQKGYTGKGVVVSILDDGVQTNHPDLAMNYILNIFSIILQRIKQIVLSSFGILRDRAIEKCNNKHPNRHNVIKVYKHGNEWDNFTGAWWLLLLLKVHRVERMKKWLVIKILYKEVALYKDNIISTAAATAVEGETGNPHQTFEANKLNQL
ncbi:hypothetical protein AGLY_010765 [Aphis glycines]|uniref:Peptidase S8/S53 domain-containing protein n=1 Tax=Aphis glycines TaxID=307491 RepID=A0A6G0TEG7_APHGL|nr:hypothetical protein AGLY_010765 [Aphis glycines]